MSSLVVLYIAIVGYDGTSHSDSSKGGSPYSGTSLIRTPLGQKKVS